MILLKKIYSNEVYLITFKNLYYQENKSIDNIIPYIKSFYKLFTQCSNNKFSDNLKPIDQNTGKEIINIKYDNFSKYCYEDNSVPEEVKKIIKS
jgi:hypothetical protein